MEYVYCGFLKLLIIFISLKFFNCHVCILFLLLTQVRGIWHFMHSYPNQGMSKIQEEGDSFSQMSPHVPTLQVYIYVLYICMYVCMYILAVLQKHENKFTFYATDL